MFLFLQQFQGSKRFLPLSKFSRSLPEKCGVPLQVLRKGQRTCGNSIFIPGRRWHYPIVVTLGVFSDFLGHSFESIVSTFSCGPETLSDSIELSNFDAPLSDRKLLPLCGSNIDAPRRHHKYLSDGSFFRVTFRSNDRYDATGFRASYRFFPKHKGASKFQLSFISLKNYF